MEATDAAPTGLWEMEQALISLGINLDDQNFINTPARWLKYMREFTQKYDPRADLSKTFDEPVDDIYSHAMIVQQNIPYQAVCAHHLVPVLGRSHVGYVPKAKVVGLSKLTRLVWGYSHEQPSLQEDIGNKVADALMEHLDAEGAICVISAEHGCMACRGVAQQEIITTTASVRGLFKENVAARQEFYSLVNLGR